jgi:hypothetical protein
MAIYKLNNTDAFLIRDASGVIYTGGDQRWYDSKKEYRKEAACGATTCSNIMSYFAQSSPELSGLCPFDLHSRDSFLELMKAVYPFVRPGLLGIMPGDFIRGINEYSASRGFKFETRFLSFPATRKDRPAAGSVYLHIKSALQADLPVAFLNLSNGRVRHLDSYHWVTVTALDDEKETVVIVDNGRSHEIDLAKWIKKTTMGGGFVSASNA